MTASGGMLVVSTPMVRDRMASLNGRPMPPWADAAMVTDAELLAASQVHVVTERDDDKTRPELLRRMDDIGVERDRIWVKVIEEAEEEREERDRRKAGIEPPPVPVNDAAWWNRRLVLLHIRQAARARMVSPAAVLGGVLCRVLCSVPPTVTLPPIVGAKASLNFWVGLVGTSGDGKSTAMAVAEECLPMGHVTTLNPGSGEGVAASYVRRGDPRAKPPEPPLVQYAWAVHFTVDEVESLTALAGRSGNTLWAELRKSWTGAALGFSNRDPKTRLPVDAHAYRLTMTVGVQPTKAGPILDDYDAGTPQRFLWLPTTDPTAPDVDPEWHRPMPWSPPWETEVAGATSLVVAPEIAEEIRQIRRERRKGKGDPMAGHRALTRLKVAAALAILDQRMTITWSDSEHVADDWSLAGDILASSDQVLGEVKLAIAQEAAIRNERAARAKGASDVTREEITSEAAIRRVCQWLLVKVGEGEEPVSLRDLSRKVASRDRHYLTEALDRLVGTGELIEEKAPTGRSSQYRRAAR